MSLTIENLQKISQAFAHKSFVPHQSFRGKHAQTLIGYLSPRRFKLQRELQFDEARLFEIEPGVTLLAHCRWQKIGVRQIHPTLILVHGLEGSSKSVYMLGTAAKAFAAGFNVVRLNLRTCGDTGHLTDTIYNAGLSGDVRLILKELIERDKISSIFLAGFSLGGNICLKLAGELGDSAPPELRGVAAVSPSIDLSLCASAIELKENWLYQQRFVSSLKKRLRVVQKLYPEVYDLEKLRETRTIREFDTHFTTIYGGFEDVEDYYSRSSALQFAANIRVPSLIIHAQDDPFVPFDSFKHPSLTQNPFITLLTPAHGGHVGFISNRQSNEDRFWAENRLVEFCRLIAES